MTTQSAPVTDTAPASPSNDQGQNPSTPPAESTPPADQGTPPANPQQQNGGTPPAEAPKNDAANPDNASGTFTVPEAYKDQPWASKVKSADDLWKQLANAQTLIGRKHPVPDFNTATPQEIENYLAQTRPENPDAYKFDTEEGYQPSGLEPEFAKAFHKAGIHPHIGNELIKDLQGVLKAGAEKAFDADEFLTTMEKAFGNGYEVKTNQTRQLIEANLSKEDNAALEGVPNKYLTLMYKLANNLRNAYGVKESGLQGEHNPSPIKQDVGEVRKSLRAEIAAIDKRPHTADEKQALIDKLNATYQQPAKR